MKPRVRRRLLAYTQDRCRYARRRGSTSAPWRCRLYRGHPGPHVRPAR